MKLFTAFDIFKRMEGVPTEPRIIDEYDELFRHIIDEYIDAALTSDKAYTRKRILSSLESMQEKIQEAIDIVKE